MKQVELLNRRFIGHELKDLPNLFKELLIVDEYLEMSQQLSVIDQKIVLYQLEEVLFLGREVVGYDTDIVGHTILKQKDFSPCLAERSETELSDLSQLSVELAKVEGDFRVVIGLDQKIVIDRFL